MSDVLPIVKVKHKKYNIEMIINEKDFDKEIHEPLDKKAKALAKAAKEESKKKVAEEEAEKTVEEEAKAAEEAAVIQALMGEN